MRTTLVQYGSQQPYKVEANCTNWKLRTQEGLIYSEWKSMMPGTNGDEWMKVICEGEPLP